MWRPGGFTDAIDVDVAGNVWVCGNGGAAKRDVATGAWQRYRITNTANFDQFNRDIYMPEAAMRLLPQGQTILTRESQKVRKSA